MTEPEVIEIAVECTCRWSGYVDATSTRFHRIWTCPACASEHDENWDDLNPYVDERSGK